MAYPARVLALILSDVIGDDLDVIGSGMTAPDASTFAGAKAVLEKYGILDRVRRPAFANGWKAACAAKSARLPNRAIRLSRVRRT